MWKYLWNAFMHISKRQALAIKWNKNFAVTLWTAASAKLLPKMCVRLQKYSWNEFVHNCKSQAYIYTNIYPFQRSGTCSLLVNVEVLEKDSLLFLIILNFTPLLFPPLLLPPLKFSVESLSAGHASPVTWCLKCIQHVWWRIHICQPTVSEISHEMTSYFAQVLFSVCPMAPLLEKSRLCQDTVLLSRGG